mgnify:CR=1 FL=1
MAGKAKIRNGDGKVVGRAKAEQDDEAMDVLSKTKQRMMVEAIAADRCGTDAGYCNRHGDGVARCCCFSLPADRKNQTIPRDSPDRQSSRPLSCDGYAPVSFLRPSGRRRLRTGDCQPALGSLVLSSLSKSLDNRRLDSSQTVQKGNISVEQRSSKNPGQCGAVSLAAVHQTSRSGRGLPLTSDTRNAQRQRSTVINGSNKG